MTIPCRNSPEIMAVILAETVVEISDRVACRRTLAFAGFTDKQIDKHLTYARNRARHLRIAEIERLVRKQLEI
jgi:hypothetical protein